MGKYLRTLTIIILLTSCVSENELPAIYEFNQSDTPKNTVVSPPITSKIEYKIELDGRLPIDANGYYHLKLNPTSNQTIHRVSGRVYNNTQPIKVSWDSNLYWWLLQGQVVANITKTYINSFTGELVYVNLPPLINWKNALVPTINSASYSGRDGEINTMIAPIYRMRYDTLVVTMRFNEQNIKQNIKIVLE